MSNLELWNKVKTTDTEYTKKVSFGRSFTSISPQYQIMKATEQFGPYGLGWGFSSCDMDFSQKDDLGLVIVKAVFFYVVDGKEYTFPLNNSWPIRQSTKPDAKIDPDFVKKAETNTMSKALSKLGFSADIFMGQFDDQDYVQSLQVQEFIDKADKRDAAVTEKQQELIEYVKNHISSVERAATINEVNGVVRSATKHLERNKNIPELNQIAERAIVALKEKAEEKKTQFLLESES